MEARNGDDLIMYSRPSDIMDATFDMHNTSHMSGTPIEVVWIGMPCEVQQVLLIHKMEREELCFTVVKTIVGQYLDQLGLLV